MNEEEFELLSVKVLCGEASDEEVAGHLARRAGNPAWEDLFGKIQEADAILRDGIAAAIASESEEPEEISEEPLQDLPDQAPLRFPVKEAGPGSETLQPGPKASEKSHGDTLGPRNKFISFILPLAAAIAVFLVVKNGWLLTTENPDEPRIPSEKDPVVQEKGIKGEREGNLLIGNLRWDAARTGQGIAAIDIREEIRRLEQEVEEATAVFANVSSDEEGFLTLLSELQVEISQKKDETNRGPDFAIKGDLEAILKYDDPTEKLSMLTNYGITQSLSDSETIRLLSEITEAMNAITSNFDHVTAKIITDAPPVSSED